MAELTGFEEFEAGIICHQIDTGKSEVENPLSVYLGDISGGRRGKEKENKPQNDYLQLEKVFKNILQLSLRK